MRRLAPLLIAALAVAGCATRERANPFDPENPNTLGRPVGFVALADDNRVLLQWLDAGATGLQGYAIDRRTPADTGWRRIATLLVPGATSYADNGTLNGLDHSYRLSYLFESSRQSPPAEDTATPGPASPWVADSEFGRLARLTPDGRHVASDRAGFSGPEAVAVDTLNGDVWMSDAGGDLVWRLQPASGVLASIPTTGTPADLAVDHGGAGVWVACENGGEARFLDGGGLLRTIRGLGRPTGLALDALDGSLWVCERDSGRVRRIDADDRVVSETGVSTPSRIALDAVTRQAWVTSFASRHVWRLSPGGAIELTLTSFGGPIGVAIDSRRGQVWIADSGLDRVVVLERDGTTAFTVAGLDAPRAVAVDVETGEGWIACAGSGEIVRVAADGTVLRRLDAFGSASGIAIDPLARHP